MERALALWNRLVAPAVSVKDPIAQREARFMASFLLAAACVYYLFFPVRHLLAGHAIGDYLIPSLLGGATMTIGYLISRQGYPKQAIGFVLVYGVGYLFFRSVQRGAEDGVFTLYYLYMIILFGSFFSTLEITLATFVVCIVGMAILPNFTDVPRKEVLAGPLSYLLGLLPLTLVYMVYRQRLENERRSQLETVESRFRAAIDGSMDVFYILESVRDEHGKITDFRAVEVNKGAEIQSEMSREQMIGALFCETYPIHRKNGFFEILVNVVETRQPFTAEVLVTPEYPAPGWYHYQVVPVGDGLAVMKRDINQRKLTEEKLQESQRFVEQITKTIPDIVYVYDLPDEKVVYSNRELSDLLSLQEVRQKQMESTGSTIIMEVEFEAKNEEGEWRTMYTRERIFTRDAQGIPNRLLGVAQDITDWKRAEAAIREQERLRVALQKEQELSHLRARMMERLSHEIRTPLTVISTASEFLILYLDKMDKTERRKHFNEIRGEVQTLSKMLADINFVVRGQLKDRTINFHSSSLARLCQKVITHMKDTIDDNHVVSLTHDSDLPMARVDSELMQMVITNLLSNAIKYSAAGTPIYIHAGAENGHVVLSIRDEGKGISAADQPRIFEPFYRGSNINEVSGIGLGLSIAREIIDLHEGRIEIESQEQQGTTVKVYLPKIPDEIQKAG